MNMQQNHNGQGAGDPVDAIVDQAFIAAGYTSVGTDSTLDIDDEKMKARALEVVRTKVVSNPKEKSAKAISQGELYAAVFPDGPGADPDSARDLSSDEYDARRKLVRRVWNLTNPGRHGYIQKRLGANGSLVLCRTTIMRDLDEVKGCYVTDHPDLIIVDSLRPQVEAMVKQANNLAKHFEMLGGRHPGLEGRMLGELGTGINKAVAALPTAEDGSAETSKKGSGS
jgi:hypothetical protein